MSEKVLDKELIEEFKSHISTQLDAGTVDNYVSAIGHLRCSLEQLKNMSDSDLVNTLNKFILRNEKLARRYASLHLLNMLNRDYLKCRIKETEQPAREIEKKWLSFDEIKQLVDSADNTGDKLIIMLQYDTACRISAILNLRYDSIDEQNNLVTLTEKKTEQSRTVALSKKTRELLDEFVRKNGIAEGRVFRRGYSYRTVWEKQRRLFGKVFSDKKFSISSHWFRASRAVHLFQKGHDIITIKELLGHRSLESTYDYLRMSGITSKELMEREEPKW